jgi:acid stress chaperone HdeB
MYTRLVNPTPGESTMKLMMTASVAAIMLAVVPARAEKLDLSLISCKQFFEGQKPDTTAIILGWLHGYYRDEKDPPVIDTEEFKSDLTKFGTYCALNPSVSIITAADKVLGK